MKFSNGCWLQQKGIQSFGPSEAHFVTIEDNKVTIIAPTTKITQRGDTLGGINITIIITSPAPDVLHIQAYHHLGGLEQGPAFTLEQTTLLPLTTAEQDNILTISSGNLTLVIDKDNFSMTYYRHGELLTKSIGKDLACMKTDWYGDYYEENGDDDNTYMRQQLTLGVGELIYGLGEHFTAFAKNGQNVEIWNEDGGTSTHQSYKNIPFYLTNKGYGVFVNHPENVSFEVASETVTKVQFSVEGGALDYYIINGPSMKEVLTRYTDLTGKPSLPAPWTFGLWLSTSFTTNYDEKTVMSFIDGMLDRGIPLRTFHFDCFWMKEFHWTDFLWDERVFPDPSGMLRRIKEKGLNICVWINPYIAQASRLFAEGKEHGYLVKKTNGAVWQWDMWQPGMALVDFTNPAACKWFQGYLKELLDIGVDCFKTDFGERIPTNVTWSDGSDAKKMHNYYTYLYNQCVYDLLEQERGKGQAVLFARSATVGGQKFPVHWGGDCWSDYESMEESLRGGLSLLMSGFGYWAHDIGGFEQTSTADVYKRWVAFGLLSSHSRLHGSTSYRVPWLYDEEAVDVVRFFTRLKARLMPYLYQTAINTSKSGVPMMRSMVLEYTHDRNCNYLDKQYMLGDSLLVAPIFNDQSIAEYYLPDGVWTNFFTGDIKEGGHWYTETCPYLSIPLYVKENAIVAIGSHDDRPDYDYENDVELRAYALQDGAEVTVNVSNMNNQIALTGLFEKTADGIKVQVETDNTFTIRLVHLKATSISIGNFILDGDDTIISCLGNTTLIVK